MGRSRICIASSVATIDEFLDLPPMAQAAYFQLSFDADNDGAIDGFKRKMKSYGATEGDAAALFDAGYLLEVDGVVFITHWLINNNIDKRAKSGGHPRELAKIKQGDKQEYRLPDVIPSNSDVIPSNSDVNRKEKNVNESNLNESKSNESNIKESNHRERDPTKPFHRQCLEILSGITGVTQYNIKPQNAEYLDNMESCYSLDEIEEMIRFKDRDWIGTKYYIHLVPDTLFSEKHFEEYIQQSKLAAKKPQDPVDEYVERVVGDVPF